MKLMFNWDASYAQDTITIQGHPKYQTLIETTFKTLQFGRMIQVRDGQNERIQKIPLTIVETFSALGHLSKVRTIDNDTYFYASRLKQLVSFEQAGFLRINNATILNLNQIASFKADANARLVVFTQSGREYRVSRHYAQQIKERLK